MKVFGIIFVAVLVVLFGAYAYFGGFYRIEIKTVDAGGETYIYESATGDYSQTGKIMDSLYNKIKTEEKIEMTKGIGVYYDDPKKVETAKLRFEVGEILENVPSEKLAELQKKYTIKTVPKGKYAVVEFPYKGMPSIFVGVARVYPVLTKFITEKNISGPSIEIYDVPNKKTFYMIQIPE